jgi:hypothetical protein
VQQQLEGRKDGAYAKRNDQGHQASEKAVIIGRQRWRGGRGRCNHRGEQQRSKRSA